MTNRAFSSLPEMRLKYRGHILHGLELYGLSNGVATWMVPAHLALFLVSGVELEPLICQGADPSQCITLVCLHKCK